ncbi:protein TIME FOR COFFEE-like [Wolffia australiana]
MDGKRGLSRRGRSRNSGLRSSPEEEDQDQQTLSPPSSSTAQNHTTRRSLPARTAKSPSVWRPSDEMISVSVPRKARSAYAKRADEHWVSTSSPTRETPASSSGASLRKKMKLGEGGNAKSSVQDIEIEVAEVLYGLTRQFQEPSDKQRDKGMDGHNSTVPSLSPIAPKRKSPRPVKSEEENGVSSADKSLSDHQSPKSEMNSSLSLVEETREESVHVSDVKEEKKIASSTINGSREKFKIDLMAAPAKSSSSGETNPSADVCPISGHLEAHSSPIKGSKVGAGESRTEHSLDVVTKERDTVVVQKMQDPDSGPKSEKTISQTSPAVSIFTPASQQSPHKTVQLRPKNCATHCFIAKNIQCHQQIARLGPLGTSTAASPAPIYGENASNPSSFSSPFPHLRKEKCSSSSASAQADEASQKKQLPPQQPSSQMPGRALAFPLNQPSLSPALAPAKSTNPNSPSPAQSSAPNNAGIGFNYSNLSHGEAQYIMLQKAGYPFPLPAGYRGGGTHAHPLPFLNGYLHPSQLQPQPKNPNPIGSDSSSADGQARTLNLIPCTTMSGPRATSTQAAPQSAIEFYQRQVQLADQQRLRLQQQQQQQQQQFQREQRQLEQQLLGHRGKINSGTQSKLPPAPAPTTVAAAMRKFPSPIQQSAQWRSSSRPTPAQPSSSSSSGRVAAAVAAPAILGPRQLGPAAKGQQDLQHSLPPQGHLFFSNSYYQRAPPELHQASTQAAAIRGLPPPSLLQAAHFASTSGAHSLLSAPYHPLSSLKPAEQRPTSGK